MHKNFLRVIYPDNFEKKTGFDGVRRMVAERCSSAMGRELAAGMAFSADYDTVAAQLGRAAEMLAILRSDEDFPATDADDLTGRLRAVRPEGTWLTGAELHQLRRTLATLGAIASFFAAHRSDEGVSVYPHLDALSLELDAFPALVREIDRIIDRWGELKDNASPELSDIRRRLASMAGSINAAMRRVMERARRDGLIDADAAPAVRDGRLVLPLSPMNKRRIPGIVHDESASGKTVFVEPAEVVEAGNRMRELEMEEHREQVRILTAFASTLRPYIDDLLDSYTLLGRFDFIRAKAMLAADTDASLPHLHRGPAVEWYHAVHPVLRESLAAHGKEVVPLDITLTPERRILVVSGPNAGGKSVTLKTVAVVQYMMQCGMLPPLYDNSHMGMFEGIFIDIGDDQSIENELSTYSSHLRSMKTFLARGDSRTLALVDEFGAGTEPQIGGAMAQAILAQFNAQGMWGVITTHFQNLKKYAEETPGLVNGSMLYDRREMRPLFALSIGHPGSSFAIEIARKTGLPESIIAAAADIVGSEYVNLDKYLLDIARDRRYWEGKRRDIREREKRLEQVIEKYQADAEALRLQRSTILGEARREAGRILEGSNAAIERAIRDIRTAQAEREKTLEARRRLEEERRALTSADESAEPEALARSPRRKDKGKGRAASPYRTGISLTN
ncbi:MAG: endonuclease MutS2, partial [Bacteroides sp.]|nr:endonuclease MutS2 [Bacteroides sp.]